MPCSRRVHVSLPQNRVAGQQLQPVQKQSERRPHWQQQQHTFRARSCRLRAQLLPLRAPDECKDRVLELGHVSCDRRGGTDDAPLFNAVAELNGEYLAIKGVRSKDEAEQLVSEKLLTAILKPGYSLAARTAINRERGV